MLALEQTALAFDNPLIPKKNSDEIRRSVLESGQVKTTAPWKESKN